MTFLASQFPYRAASAVLRRGAWILVALFSINAPVSSAQDPNSQVANMVLEINTIIAASRPSDLEVSDLVEKYLSSIDDEAITIELAAHGFQLRPYKAPDGADIFSKYFRISLLDPFRYEIRIAIKREGGARKFRGFIFYHAI